MQASGEIFQRSSNMIFVPPQQYPMMSKLLGGREASYVESIGYHGLYHGFINGRYADLKLVIVNKALNSEYVFNIHRLVAIRSPRLDYILARDDQCSEIELTCECGNVTYEGLHAALCHLYFDLRRIYFVALSDSSPYAISFIVSLLSAAALLGLDDVIMIASESLYKHLSLATVVSICVYLDRMDPVLLSHRLISDISDNVLRYLKLDIVENVRKRFDNALWDSRDSASYKALVFLFSRLPYSFLKDVLEDPAFSVPSYAARFRFAKGVISAREIRSAGSHIYDFQERAFIEFRPRSEGRLIFTRVKKGPNTQTSVNPSTRNYTDASKAGSPAHKTQSSRSSCLSNSSKEENRRMTSPTTSTLGPFLSMGGPPHK